jgi:hypothetical protein
MQCCFNQPSDNLTFFILPLSCMFTNEAFKDIIIRWN